MNEQEYRQAIDEMALPASKILFWANTIKREYYDLYDEANRNLFDRIIEESYKLIALIERFREESQSDKSESEKIETFTHILGGPITAIKGYAEMILLNPFRNSQAEQLESDKEPIEYLKKIKSAAEYLWSLDRDALLKMMLERLRDEDKNAGSDSSSHPI